MDSTDKNRDFVPLLCRWLGTIISEPASHTRIANTLAIACRRLLNGGRFPNARADWENERSRMPFCIAADDWNTIKTARSAFWHFEGQDLVVDFYSVPHERRMLQFKKARRKAGIASARARKSRPAKKAVPTYVGTINKEISPKGDISNSPSPPGAGGAFDDEGHPCTPQASPEEVRAIFAEIYANGQAD